MLQRSNAFPAHFAPNYHNVRTEPRHRRRGSRATESQPATGDELVSDSPPENNGQPEPNPTPRDHWYQRRPTQQVVVIVGIVLVHALVGYGLTRGWISLPKQQPRSIEVSFIDDPKPPEDPPPQPHVDLARPTLAITVPEPIITPPPDESPVTATIAEQASYGPSDPADNQASGSPLSTEKHIPYRIRAHFVAPVDPNQYYPQLSKRIGEHGIVQLNVCVNDDGHYDGNPTVRASSGYPRIDRAGVQLVLENKMVPETVDGRAMHSCTLLEIEFTLPH